MRSKKVEGIEKKDFRLYKPFIANLRKKSYLSLMYYFFNISRRLILLYIAMFLA